MGGAWGTYIGEKKCIQVSWGNLKERDNLKDPSAVGMVILKLMFRKYGVRARTGFVWLRKGQMADRCKRGNEPSGSMICGEFRDWLRTS
jgi:hypothetical protein